MTRNAKPLKVFGYARLSKATEESTSIERQLELARTTAEGRGWELLGTDVDEDVSATRTRLERPGLNRLRARVAAGGVDAVVVWRVDRLARSLSDLLILVEEFAEKGTALVSATEPFDSTTPGGKAMLSMLGVFAALEADTVRERVSASREALRQARRFPGGRVPYGYRTAPNPVGAGRILVPDEFEAGIVREAAERVLQGESLYAVVNDLNSRGVKPRTAAAWAISSLKWLLVGDSVLGRVTVGGDVMRDDAGLPLEVWTPLIDGDTSARLREALGGTARPANPVAAPRAS